MKVLIIGLNSFVAKYFIRSCEDSKIDYVACSHQDIPKSFDGFTWVINFTINPKFFTQKHSESIDQDIFIAKLVSEYKDLKYAMISSRMVYGSNNSLVPIAESCKVIQKPNSIYGSNKVLSECNVRSIIKPHNLLIIRASNIFGYEFGRKSFTGAALSRLARKSEIVLDISQKTIRDFIPVNYFSNCLMQLMFKKSSGVYNIGSGIGVSLEDLCNAMIKGYGSGHISTEIAAEINDQFILDNQKMLGVVDFSINKRNILEYAMNAGNELKIEQECVTKVEENNV